MENNPAGFFSQSMVEILENNISAAWIDKMVLEEKLPHLLIEDGRIKGWEGSIL